MCKPVKTYLAFFFLGSFNVNQRPLLETQERSFKTVTILSKKNKLKELSLNVAHSKWKDAITSFGR